MNEQRATLESLQKRLEEKEVALDNAEKELVEIKAEKVVASDEIEGLEKNEVLEEIKNKDVEVSQTLMEEGGRFLIAKESRVGGSEMKPGGKSDLMFEKELALVEQISEQNNEKPEVRLHYPLMKDPKLLTIMFHGSKFSSLYFHLQIHFEMKNCNLRGQWSHRVAPTLSVGISEKFSKYNIAN